MGRPKAEEKRILSAYFTPGTFVLEEFDQSSGEASADWANAFAKDRYEALYHLGFLSRADWFSSSLEYLHLISERLLEKLSRQPEIELNRDLVEVSPDDDEVSELLDALPFVIGMEYVDADWIRRLWDRLLAVYRAEIKVYEGTVARYFADHHAHINVAGRVFFHLVENAGSAEPFAFMATYTTKPVKSKRAVHTPLKNALAEFQGDEKMLLSLITAVIKAAEKSVFISGLLESGELFSPLRLSAAEAYTFLTEVPLYEESGIMCRVPDWWRKKNNSARLSVTVGAREPSKLGLDAILDFKPQLSLGGEPITEQALRSFLDMAEGLIQYKGKWVEVDKKKLETLLAAFDKVNGLSQDDLSLVEAMQLELDKTELLKLASPDIEVTVSNGEWLKSLKEKLTNPEKIEKLALADTFRATLRAYQETGYRWLNEMASLGLGACLADDMGLGKTVQMIAFLEYLRSLGRGPMLLVLPASLIGNWQNEISRFAPEMPYQTLHKSELKGSKGLEINEDGFLSITTYGMALRLEELKQRKWDCLILDEAQAIKNPGTKQTKAIKAIPARMRIAMTGTPIENRLGDLWSLFDFLNQGLLGSAKEFGEFTKELQDNPAGYGRLRKMIQPFILRRLKTDKTIISDLPDKLEMNAYTTLSKQQIALYKKVLQDIGKKLSEAEGIERKGLVLASIMKFKQICNHPDQFLGREEYKAEHSGKFEQLREICETIRDKKERVIVFTQFKEMTEPLAEYLTAIFDKEGLVLHGETPIKKRKEMVAQFNGENYIPFMVLSLKAGGVGLNLTSANHVIHFDRWWNPAVENQATDRAFRIGQTKNVMVHKFVTRGTIEEKIDELIAAKQQLSADILGGGGEGWITEYSNEELLKMFALGGDLA